MAETHTVAEDSSALHQQTCGKATFTRTSCRPSQPHRRLGSLLPRPNLPTLNKASLEVLSFNVRPLIVVLLLASSLLDCTCHAQTIKLANLISNPSFESTTAAAGSGVLISGSNSPNPLRGGWRVSSADEAVTLYASSSPSSTGAAAFHGSNSVLLGTSCTAQGGYQCSHGTLYQSFSTTPDVEYTVTIKVTGEATSVDGSSSAVLRLLVADAGLRTAIELDAPWDMSEDLLLGWASFEYPVSPTTMESDRLAWAQVGPLVFTAKGMQSVLYLRGGSDLGQPAVYVDMVEVFAVPGPLTGEEQRFTWPIPLSNLYLSGSAMYMIRGSPLLQLTPKAADSSGLALIKTPFLIMDNGWTSDGNATCTPLSFSVTVVFNSDRGGGSGLAIVLTTDPSLGASGENLGYARRQLSTNYGVEVRRWGTVAVELDAVKDIDVDDISSSHVGLNLHASGVEVTPRSVVAMDTSTAAVGNLFDGLNKSVWVKYDGGAKTMQVYLARTQRKPNNIAGDMPAWPVLSMQFDPCNVYSNPTVPVYVGIAGATTSSRLAKQTVLAFSFAVAAAGERVPPPPPPSPPPPPQAVEEPVKINARQGIALLLAADDWNFNFGGSNTWQLSNPCRSWEGVTCDDSGQVVALSSGSFFLNGALSVHLSSLTSLTRIDLWYNFLSGGVPTEWTTLTNLKFLDVSRCGLSGELLESPFTAMTGLTLLKLNENSFNGSMPDIFPALQSLEIVNLCNNNVEGMIPTSVSSLTNLKALSLCYNKLYGDFPEGLQELPNLAVLDLRGNHLSGPLPTSFVSPALADNSQSRFLRLDNNYFTGSATLKVVNEPICLLPSNPSGTSTGDNSGVGDRNSIRRNCLTFDDATYPPDCQREEQRDLAIDCSSFCGANETEGVCSGHGVCFLSGPSLVPTCLCDPGWTFSSQDQMDCRVRGEASVPLPPPPSGKAGLTAGLSLVGDLRARSKNQWSRYLSNGYSEVDGWTIKTRVDWRRSYDPKVTLPPITDQGSCGLCWAVATVDAIAAAVEIARNGNGMKSFPELSVAQMVECQPGLTASVDVCSGSFPTAGLDLASQSGLLPLDGYPVTTLAFYNTTTTGRSCQPKTLGSVPERLVMYEAVQFNGWFGMLLTVQRQPIIASLQSSSASFQQYFGQYVYQDPGCYTGTLDHVVLLVGYRLDVGVPYWIIRNSWGSTWGSEGYMRLGIQGGDGVCGINILPALYPIPAPSPNDPCYLESVADTSGVLMNPCGGGTCVPKGGLSYTCNCPDSFVAADNTMNTFGNISTQSCVPKDVCGFGSTNPCIVGNCVNDMRGGYSCVCPPGYFQTNFTDGGLTCAPSSGGIPTGVMTYKIQPEVSCYVIYMAYGLTEAQFLSQNPGLNCLAPTVGRVVNVTNTAFQGCTVPFVAYTDTESCTVISNFFNISASQILAYNPGLNCSKLYRGQQVCIDRKGWMPPGECTSTYQVMKSDTCDTIIMYSRVENATEFFRLNQGINCDQINPPTANTDTPGLTVCLAADKLSQGQCPQGKVVYTVVHGDTCLSLAVRFKFQCGTQRLYVTQKICVLDSSANHPPPPISKNR